MKVFGIILAIAGGIGALIGIIGSGENAEKLSVLSVVFVVSGIFLIRRANKKKTETEEK